MRTYGSIACSGVSTDRGSCCSSLTADTPEIIKVNDSRSRVSGRQPKDELRI